MALLQKRVIDDFVNVLVADKDSTNPPEVCDLFKNAFRQTPRWSGPEILEKCYVDSTTSPNNYNASSLVTLRCTFNLDRISRRGYSHGDRSKIVHPIEQELSRTWRSRNTNTPLFCDYFVSSCKRFSKMLERGKQLWLSTDIREAFLGDSAYDQTHFGLSMKSFSLGAMKDRCTFTDHFCLPLPGSTVDFEHDSKLMTINFSLCKTLSRTLRNRYEMQLRYDELDDLILVDESKPLCRVYFMLNTPPRIYRIQRFKNGRKEKYRVLEAHGNDFQLTSDTIGNSSVLSLTESRNQQFQDVIKRLQGLGKTIYWTCVNVEYNTSTFSYRPNFRDCFELQYSLKCLLSRGFVVTDRADDLLSVLSELPSHRYKQASVALDKLALQVDKHRFTDLKKQLKKNLKDASKFCESDDELEYSECRFVRRVIITPTRCLFLPAELAYENRILRQNGEEYCLRIAFRDEDFYKLRSYEVSRAAEILSRIESTLNQGIQIGQRHYEFLACSNSQLRDHGCWLYARDQSGNTAATIRDWMGDFSDITCVATYIARMGQCFSKSEESVNIFNTDVEDHMEKDIMTTDGEYCFSDGIGKVSPDLAEKVSTEMTFMMIIQP